MKTSKDPTIKALEKVQVHIQSARNTLEENDLYMDNMDDDLDVMDAKIEDIIRRTKAILAREGVVDTQ